MPHAPRTMTKIGLEFLSALAAQKTQGVYLEIGPLFGSSTNAIHMNRTGDAPIHTIDTFEATPWVRKRLGIDLSRKMFDKFTHNIDNLIVHEGFAPDVVKDTWKDDIGFYFDDATHDDPDWSDNFNFFSQFFNDETIICGDDFAGGWPDIVRNVYKYADLWDVKLFVIGRVWVMARKRENRIKDAIDAICPNLKTVSITTEHGDDKRTNMAACWTWGLHQNKALDRFKISTGGNLQGAVLTFLDGHAKETVKLGDGPVEMRHADHICFNFSKKVLIQLCLANPSGKTQNTKSYKSGQMIEIPVGMRVTALRLSDI